MCNECILSNLARYLEARDSFIILIQQSKVDRQRNLKTYYYWYCTQHSFWFTTLTWTIEIDFSTIEKYNIE